MKTLVLLAMVCLSVSARAEGVTPTSVEGLAVLPCKQVAGAPLSSQITLIFKRGAGDEVGAGLWETRFGPLQGQVRRLSMDLVSQDDQSAQFEMRQTHILVDKRDWSAQVENSAGYAFECR